MVSYRKVFRCARAKAQVPSLRNIVKAINHLLKTGSQWRMLQKDFPPYKLVYYYFSKWKNEGVFEDLLVKPHIWLRIVLGRK